MLDYYYQEKAAEIDLGADKTGGEQDSNWEYEVDPKTTEDRVISDEATVLLPAQHETPDTETDKHENPVWNIFYLSKDLWPKAGEVVV